MKSCRIVVKDRLLGFCWIQVRERRHDAGRSSGEYVKDILRIPEKYVVECMVAIGYPAEDKRLYDESRLLFEKMHYNKF